MEPDHQYAEQVFEFGEAVDSPSLYFITVIDLNKRPLKIGYSNFEVTIEQLIHNYMDVTPCRDWLTSTPCFKILQNGPYKGELAIQNNKLVSYELSFDLPCFQVFDGDVAEVDILKTSAINKTNSVYNNQTIIPIIIQIKNFETEFKVKINESLKSLKKSLIKDIQPLKNENPSSLHLMKDGLFIIDEDASLKSYGIMKNTKIRVNVMKKHGCFSKSAKILVDQNRQVLINELKVGDEVVSYNQTTKMYQNDKITFIHNTSVSSIVIIRLNNGAKIETTPNHLFLCEDSVYRNVQGNRAKYENLSIGSKLKSLNNIAEIIEIQHKTLLQSQVYYHLCIEKNHNFFVQGVITHNLYLNIILPNGQERISIQPNQPFIKIKQYIEEMYEIQIYCQKLFFAGKQIQNHETMTDRNIPKEANVYLKFKPSEQFNFLEPNTPILMKQNEIKSLDTIKQGDSLGSWDTVLKSKTEKGDIVMDVKEMLVKDRMIIKIDNYQNQIVTSADCYLEIENGEAMNVRDLCYQYDHGAWPFLRRFDGSICKIKEIAHEILSQPKRFKKFLVFGDNYIAKELIIHNLVVNILVIKNNARFGKFAIGVKDNDKIGFLKSQVALRAKIPEQHIELTFDNKLLDSKAEILEYNITTANIITANSLEKVSKSSLEISGMKEPKKVNVQLSLQLSQTEKMQINYDQYKDKTIEEIMCEILPNYKSTYFFLFAQLIIYPHDLLKKIQLSQEFGDNTIIVVKNEKLAFIQNMNIQGSQVKNQSYIHRQHVETIIELSSRIQVSRQNQLENIFAAASNRIRADEQIKHNDFRAEQFYLPFLYFTSKKYNNKILNYIRKFDKFKHELNDNSSVYSIIKDLYLNMNMLPNLLGTFFFGMKSFRFSKFYKKHHTFYWHSFTIAYQTEEKVAKDVSSCNGTLFVISSLNGKDIHSYSVDPSRKQILFAPFTYFMVEKIEVYENYDKIWLSEISSPITFQKNIVLWVDDEPYNNHTLIQAILKVQDIEILQVTSTILAEKWVKQFGWLLNWRGLKFKLISDMKRVEENENNFVAGIDLLQRLYRVHGISAETLIYCGDLQRAYNNVRERNIPRQKYFSITVQEHEVIRFCKFKI